MAHRIAKPALLGGASAVVALAVLADAEAPVVADANRMHYDPLKAWTFAERQGAQRVYE